jgi:hypothetical protein
MGLSGLAREREFSTMVNWKNTEIQIVASAGQQESRVFIIGTNKQGWKQGQYTSAYLDAVGAT